MTDGGGRLQVFVFSRGEFLAEHTFDRARISVGSSADAGLALDDEGIAPLHALVELRADGIWLTNLCESGLQVDGEPADRVRLGDESVVQLGGLTLKCKRVAAQPPVPGAAPALSPAPAPVRRAPTAPPVQPRPGQAPPLPPAPPARETPPPSRRESSGAAPPRRRARHVTDMAVRRASEPAFPAQARPAATPPPLAPVLPLRRTSPTPLVVPTPPVPSVDGESTARPWPVAADWAEEFDEDELDERNHVPTFSLASVLTAPPVRPGRATDPLMVQVVQVRGESADDLAVLAPGERFEISTTDDGAAPVVRPLVERDSSGHARVHPPAGATGELRSPRGIEVLASSVPLAPFALPEDAETHLAVGDRAWVVRWARVPPLPPPRFRWRPSWRDVIAFALAAAIVVFAAWSISEATRKERNRTPAAGTPDDRERFAAVDLKEIALELPPELTVEAPTPEAPDSQPMDLDPIELDTPPPPDRQPDAQPEGEVAAAPAATRPDDRRGARRGRADRPRGGGRKTTGAPAGDKEAKPGYADALGDLPLGGPTKGGGTGLTDPGSIEVRRPAGQSIGFQDSAPKRKGGRDPLAGQGGAGGGGDPTLGKGMTFGGGAFEGDGKAGGGRGGPGQLEERKKRKIRGRVKRAAVRSVTGSGSLSREAIAAVVHRKFSQIQACYEKHLMQDPSLKGKLTLEWTIAPSGRVTSVRAASTSLGNPAVVRCVQDRVRTWSFPKPEGGSVVVTYPFVFDNAGSW